MIDALPLQELRHTRAVQVILEEGRREEAAAQAIRQLARRFGTVDQANRDRLAALPLPHVEQLAENLFDFSGPGDLKAWLAASQGA